MEDVKVSNELGLFLGMIIGDGSLPIKHNGSGYRNYMIGFYNTDKDKVSLFQKLFCQLTTTSAGIKKRERPGKQPLWQLEKYSKRAFDLIHDKWEIPEGKKAKEVFIPDFIKSSNKEIKMHFFLGLLITDGSIRKKGDILFHCASAKLMNDLKQLIKEMWGFNREVKRYIQKERFVSYQLTLNKKESSIILSQLPTWHNLVMRGS